MAERCLCDRDRRRRGRCCAAARRSKRLSIMGFGFAAAPWVGLAFTLTLVAQMTVRPVPVQAAQDRLSRFAGWRELADETVAAMNTRQAGYIATNEHGVSATLAFYLRN